MTGKLQTPLLPVRILFTQTLYQHIPWGQLQPQTRAFQLWKQFASYPFAPKVACLIIFHPIKLWWEAMFFILGDIIFWWGCRGNLKSITRGSERVKKVQPLVSTDRSGTLLSVILQVVMHTLWFGKDLKTAVELPRVHNQVSNTTYEPVEKYKLPVAIQDGLRERGNWVQEARAYSVVQAILRGDDGKLFGKSDPRKHGWAAGYWLATVGATLVPRDFSSVLRGSLNKLKDFGNLVGSLAYFFGVLPFLLSCSSHDISTRRHYMNDDFLASGVWQSVSSSM